MIWSLLLLTAAAVPSQLERGEALFFDEQTGCATCHVLKGKGTAVGPDLTVMGKLPPAAIATAARSTVTQYVQMVKVKTSKDAFPAMTGAKDASGVTLFDLSKMPPEKKVVARSTVTQYVQVVKVKTSKDAFPAMTGAKDASGVTLFDLSKMPPEKKGGAPG